MSSIVTDVLFSEKGSPNKFTKRLMVKNAEPMSTIIGIESNSNPITK